MQLAEAKQIADKICSQLYPWTEQLFIGGSIRREVSEVKDIEIVCIPKRKDSGGLAQTLFDDLPTLVSSKKTAIEQFCKVVEQWPKVLGDPKKGRYTQRRVPVPLNSYHINLDLFMCDADNLGLMLAIRTGNAEYSRRLMARAKGQGFNVHDGYMWRGSTLIAVPDEHYFFKLINLKYVHPQFRNV
jgi:DNA polymerase/3'-5' exonuclease PolX